MANQLFPISGNKINTLFVADHALLFSSGTFTDADAFTKAWEKKISLYTKMKVGYDAIKSVTMEDGSNKTRIRYRSYAGFTTVCEFYFRHGQDHKTLFTFLEKQRYFTISHAQLTPVKAATSRIGEFVVLNILLAFCYYEAVALANGTAEKASGSKARAFDYIISILGDKGVLAIGLLLNGYLLYRIWQRFTRPPGRTKLLPPNA